MGPVLFVKVCKLDLKQPSLCHSIMISDYIRAWKITIKERTQGRTLKLPDDVRKYDENVQS